VDQLAARPVERPGAWGPGVHPPRSTGSRHAFHIEQLDREQQGRSARDRFSARSAVAQVKGDRELDLVADPGEGNTFLPPLDHFVERETDRFAAPDRTVEFFTIDEGANIVDLDRVRRKGPDTTPVARDTAPSRPSTILFLP